MPKTTQEKNNKGIKKATNKNFKSNKNIDSKDEVKNIEANVPVEEVKVVAEDEKKGKNSCSNSLLENTPFVIASCIIIILLAALIFTLCIKKIPKTKNGNDVLATIKGKTFTADDLYQQLKVNDGSATLINMIDEYIAEKEAKVTDEDKKYVQEVVDYYKDYASYYGVDLKTFLANYVGLKDISTEKEFSDFVLKDYKKTIAVQKFIEDEAKEKDLKDYYEKNYTDKLTVKHILIEVDSEAEDKDKADKDAYNKAAKLIKKLKETDAKKLDSKFESLAKDNSDDTATYSNGGLISDFTKSDVVEEFWKASEKLKDGEFTEEPVKTSYGYHIILRISSTEREKYDKIKDEVKKAYAKSLLESDTTLSAKKWDELRKQYKMSIEDDEVKTFYKENLKNATSTEKDSTENKTESKAEKAED